jgi:hypothetical protein
VNFNFGHGWAVAFSPIITANWDGSDGDEWTVPLGLGITRTTVFNRRPMNLGVQYYYDVERPEGAAGQQLKLIVALLFPRWARTRRQRRERARDRVRVERAGSAPRDLAIITSVDLTIASASSPRRSFSARTASAVMTAVRN